MSLLPKRKKEKEKKSSRLHATVVYVCQLKRHAWPASLFGDVALHLHGAAGQARQEHAALAKPHAGGEAVWGVFLRRCWSKIRRKKREWYSSTQKKIKIKTRTRRVSCCTDSDNLYVYLTSNVESLAYMLQASGCSHWMAFVSLASPAQCCSSARCRPSHL